MFAADENLIAVCDKCTMYEPVVLGCPRKPLEECHLEVKQSLTVQPLCIGWIGHIPERILQVVKAFLMTYSGEKAVENELDAAV